VESAAAIGLTTFIISAIVSALATLGVIRVAPRIGALDQPGPRKVHTRPIPRLGGVGVFLGFAAGVAVAAQMSGRAFAPSHVTVSWITLAACAFAMFAMGLVDDIRGLGFKIKFLVQIAAAIAVWSGGFRIEILTHPLGVETIDLGMLSLPVTILWIVGITNAINLIDGLDGLAAGTALIMTGAVAGIAQVTGHLGVVAVSVALVGALLGFLLFNFNPARVFLGDSGSMFLGFVLAVASIRGSQKGSTAVAVLAPLLVLGLPILDTSLAVLRRLVRLSSQPGTGRGRLVHVAKNLQYLFLPDRGHIHHRLLDLGVGHRGSVLTLYVFVAGLAGAALATVAFNSVLVAVVLVGSLAVLSTASFVVFGVRRRRGLRSRRSTDSVSGSELATASDDTMPVTARIVRE